MKQHNHWKMRQFQKLIIKVILWGFGLFFLFFNYMLKKKLDFNIVSEIVSIFSIVLGLILTLIEKKLWKTRVMNLPFFDGYWTPILEGRWEGILERDGKSHNFVLEIIQSFTSISCITYTEHSTSSAYATEILFDEQLNVYKLVYYWNGISMNTIEQNRDSEKFEGFTVLDIIIQKGKAIKLNGTYFTNRQPQQTKGKIKLDFKQKTLKYFF